MKLFDRILEPYTYENPFFVAEISCNHQNDIPKTMSLIERLKALEVDSVKLQVYKPEEMALNDGYIIREGAWAGRNLFELYKKNALPFDDIEKLFKHARHIGIPIFASVFGMDSLKFLEDIGCEVYKIASFENLDARLITAVERTNKPLIISCGMVSPEYIIDNMMLSPYSTALLTCSSKYPADFTEIKLHEIDKIRSNGFVAGFSDHTRFNFAAQTATACGARIIEKHVGFEACNSDDKEFSLSPEHFRTLISDCKHVMRGIKPKEVNEEKELRRSLYAISPIKAGEMFTCDNISALRPYRGIDAGSVYTIYGNIATIDIEAGRALQWSDIEL